MIKAALSSPGLWVWRALCRRALKRFRHRILQGNYANKAVLADILRAASDTEVGKRFGFREIMAAADFESLYRERVPIRDYAAHADDIQVIAKGAADILFPGRPNMFVATSGTSSDAKLLPTNRTQQRQALKHIALLAPAMRWEAAPELRLSQRSINLMLASSPGNQLPGGIPLGMSSAGGLRKVLRAAPFIWTSPASVFELTDHSTALYLHALFGLVDEDAGCIEAVFGTHIVSWAGMLMARQHELIADVANGSINSGLPLSPEVRRKLESKLKPNPARARAIRTAFAAGEQGILPRLWPQMRVLSAAVSGGFAVSLPRLRWLTGDQIRICGTCFGATESMVGVNLWPTLHERYALSAGAAYFEFLPLSELDAANPQVVGFNELCRDECYEVVITNFAGLYRYRLGDILRVCDFIGDTPVFEFDHRLGDVIDLVGEKTTQKHTQTVVQSLAQSEFGSARAISNYTLTSDCSVVPFRYRVYIELADEAQAAEQDREHLAETFDRVLQDVNLSYRTLARSNQRLAQPVVELVESGAFAMLEEYRYQQYDGVSRNQVKVPRVLSDPEQIALLDKHRIRISVATH